MPQVTKNYVFVIGQSEILKIDIFRVSNLPQHEKRKQLFFILGNNICCAKISKERHLLIFVQNVFFFLSACKQ